MGSLFNRHSVPSQQEFHQAISRSGNAWYSACLRITRDSTLAQDAVQDGLLNAWQKRRQFREGARLETWIHRIAINSALALIRRRRVFTDVPEQLADGDEPDKQLESRELNQELEQALKALSELECVCFVLKHLEQWRISEIADHMNIGEGSVKQALFRAVKKLRAGMHGLRETS
ncbi:MAG: RNA polymerase sigma factor [Gammaproteobacteria bacterium]